MMRISLTHRAKSDVSGDVMTPAERVIDTFGGLTPLARALGFPVSTVQGWKERGEIPQRHWLPIMNVAKEAGISLKLEDFLEPITAERFDEMFPGRAPQDAAA
jgi:hypothetical protein